MKNLTDFLKTVEIGVDQHRRTFSFHVVDKPANGRP